MIKTQGLRKLATIVAMVFATSMFLAACSTQSSTDEALSHPGDNFMGSMVFTVDPASDSLTVTQVSSVSNTGASVKDGFAVSTTGAVRAGTHTRGVLNLKWKGPDRLEDASIRLVSGDAVAQNALLRSCGNGVCDGVEIAGTCPADCTLPGYPNLVSAFPKYGGQNNVWTAAGNTNPAGCVSTNTLSVQLAAGCLPGFQIIGDSTVTGTGHTAANNTYPGYVPECNTTTGVTCSGTFARRGIKAVGPGCGTGGTVIPFNMALTEGSATRYQFTAHLFGERKPASIYADSRYDLDGYNMVVQTFAFQNVQNPLPDATRRLTTVKQNQWFAAVVSVDSAGDLSRGNAAYACRDISGTLAGCGITSATFQQNDYFMLDDLSMFNARDAHPLWATSSASNTGFVIQGNASFALQWDPAVLTSNDVTYAVGGSSGSNNFTTAGSTNMVTNGDADPLDDYAVTSQNNRNFVGFARVTNTHQWNYATSNPPDIGDGLDGADYGTGLKQGDFIAGYVALKAIGPVGSGATIQFSPSGNSVYNVIIGKGATNNAGVIPVGNNKSRNYPKWNYAYGTGEANASNGHFNEQIAGICIQ